ncbi:GNAT family N-acetyltransferase [Pyxidicoccus caerfyrddinensis]|uniref:GNAT family N-acetyltransferase n=1 Tax=Pyxidicoccus caerfyrddinensis TaxID=2709663 RepID=UPI001F086BDE|nr:GNAT family N-acetyltransferase [Pyxidicoccus caerfyrddinensis]
METRPLRHAVLRPHQSPNLVVYPGDEDVDTVHLGAYAAGRLVGVASLYREPPPDALRTTTAWRLRGMAVDPTLRGSGHGAALLQACMVHARGQGGTLAWCNARATAAGFYRSLGFSPKGDPFELPGIGLHHFMWRALESSR